MVDPLSANPQTLVDAAAAGLNQSVTSLVGALPNLVFAVVLVVIGWFVGNFVAMVLKKVLQLIKFEPFLEAHRVEDALGNVKVSNVFVQLFKYFVIILFVQQAVAMLALGSLSEFLGKVIDYAPKLIGGIMVVVVAAIVGELAKEKVMEVHEKEDYMKLLGTGIKYIVVFMGIVMGLDTLGFPTTIITATFVSMVQALGLALGLAVGLAFGFGGQEAAKDWIKEWRKRLNV